MSQHYPVSLRPPDGHVASALLSEFAAWLEQQEYGALGKFELVSSVVPETWDQEAAARLQKDAWCFASLPDGSLLALVDGHGPAPVVLLGSEGAERVLGQSLEAFLTALAAGDTGVHELDEEGASGRAALRSWLEAKRIKTPNVEHPFDFGVYLSGEPRPPSPPVRPASPEVATYAPAVRELVELLGRTVDDPELVRYVATTLGKNAPSSTSDGDDRAHVVVPQLGLELIFSHRVRNEMYPPAGKSGRSYVPYFTAALIGEKFTAPLPLGLRFGMSADEAQAVLGEPTGTWRVTRPPSPLWQKWLDESRAIQLLVICRNDKRGMSVTFSIKENR